MPARSDSAWKAEIVVALFALFGSACSTDAAPNDADADGADVVDTTTEPDVAPVYDLTVEAAMDPASCAPCHPQHYDEWRGSMHAYAAEDPVFVAMNARGQEATDGALGDLCVRCHAPMAVLTGATVDGTNLDQLPDTMLGVTCYFCHNVVDVTGTHNNPLVLANDLVMRGGLRDPMPTRAHPSAYSSWHDRGSFDSAAMCGSCHDVVLPDSGVALERTYAEWRETLFADPDHGFGLTCNSCHMRGSDGFAASVPGAPARRIHGHTWPGVDVALTEFPNRAEQRALIQQELNGTLLAQVCVFPTANEGAEVRVAFENVGAGHNFPSGASHDRRAWVELVAYRDGVPIYESGVVEADEAVRDVGGPDVWLMGDEAFDAEGEHVTMFWEVEAIASTSLPAQTTIDPEDPRWIDTHIARVYPALDAMPDRVTVRVLMRPFGLEILDDLVASGHLDPAVRDAMPTFELQTTNLEWTRELGRECQPQSLNGRPP